MRSEQDVVLARQRARQVAALLDLDRQDQARVATAVSELARNAFQYAGGGRIEYRIESDPDPLLAIHIVDAGPGIANLDTIVRGDYQSPTGMGVGIPGAARLMDRFEIESTTDGTRVTMAKRLRGPAATAASAARIAEVLARKGIEDPITELRMQNQELIGALDELQARQQELARLNQELEETNRGVVALYAELDERAEDLRLASEAKSRFLSSVTHELRTPLSSTLALTELLLDRTDGPLGEEQERQIRYIRAGAESLLSLVNDLLDLARIEAGKTAVDITTFAVEDLFAALRGMFRPLHTNQQVDLVLEAAPGIDSLSTDQSKVAQVLRNLISNALKFTENGEVRVRARDGEAAETVVFAVTDTGVGIDPADLERIFDEFEQVDGALQLSAKGTGLGLPISRRLAETLGGDIGVASEPGVGSTFILTLPRAYSAPPPEPHVLSDQGDSPRFPAPPAAERRALVIDDDEIARYVGAHVLQSHGFSVDEANDGISGLRRAYEHMPDLILLDLRMPGIDGFGVLEQLKADPATATIPVIVQTAKPISADERNRLDLAAAVLDKRDSNHGGLSATLKHLGQPIAQT